MTGGVPDVRNYCNRWQTVQRWLRGDVLKVEKLGAAAGETVTFDQVIAVSNDGLKVGADVAGATVTATVVGEGKGKKVIVYKYKRKTGYHKKNGHRQAYTQVKIEKSTLNHQILRRYVYDDDSNSKDKGFLSGV